MRAGPNTAATRDQATLASHALGESMHTGSGLRAVLHAAHQIVETKEGTGFAVDIFN